MAIFRLLLEAGELDQVLKGLDPIHKSSALRSFGDAGFQQQQFLMIIGGFCQDHTGLQFVKLDIDHRVISVPAVNLPSEPSLRNHDKICISHTLTCMQFQCKQVILRDIVNVRDESGLGRNYLTQTRSFCSQSGPMCVKNSKRPV